MVGLLVFIFHAGIMPVLSGLALARVLKCKDGNAAAITVYSLGFWIGLTALLTDLAMRFAPGLPQPAYIAAYVILSAAVVVAALWKWPAVRTPETNTARSTLTYVLDAIRQQDTLSQVILVVLAGYCTFVLVSAVVQPLVQNDPITHTIIARHLAEARSAAAYPFAQADESTGYLIEAVHPLGFPASKSLVMLLLADLDTAWHKPLSAVFLVYLAASTGVLAARVFGRHAGIYASGLVVLTPLIFKSATVAHIDPLWVYGFFVGFAALAEYGRNPLLCWKVVGSIGLTICLHSHAGNIIAFALMAPLFLIVASGPMRTRLATGVAIVLPALIFCAPQYVHNYMTNGSIAATSYALERENPEPFQTWYSLKRDVASTSDAIINGALAPFTKLEIFGIAFWLAMAGIALLAVRRQTREPATKVIVGAFLAYAAIVAVAVLTGRIEFYMNDRYMLVVLPFAAVLAGYALASARNVAASRFGSPDGNLHIDSLLARCTWAPVRIGLALAGIYLLVNSDQLTALTGWIGAKLAKGAIALGAIASQGMHASSRNWRDAGQVILVLAALLALWRTRAILLRLPIVTGFKAAFAGGWPQVRGLGIEVAALYLLTNAAFAGVHLVVTDDVKKWFRAPFTESDIVMGSDLKKVEAALAKNEKSVNLLSSAIELRRLHERDGSGSGRTLALRDSEVYYYGSGYIYSVYDRRIWPALQAQTAQESQGILKSLGIGTLYVPNYTVPAVDRTGVEDLLHDPARRTILHENELGNFSVYSLLDRPRNYRAAPMLELVLSPPQKQGAGIKALRRNILADFVACGNPAGAPTSVPMRFWVAPENSIVCDGKDEMGPWMRLPRDTGNSELLIEAETRSTGCLLFTVYQRLPHPSAVRGFVYSHRTLNHLSLTELDHLKFGLKRQEGADAISIFVDSKCNKPANLLSLKLVSISGVE